MMPQNLASTRIATGQGGVLADRSRTLADMGLLGAPSGSDRITAEGQAAQLTSLAAVAAQNGLWDQAFRALEQAHRFVPNDTNVLLDLGHSYFVRRRFQEAIVLYQRVIELRPNWAVVYVNLSGLLINMGKPDVAVAAARIGLRLDPDLASLYVNLASALRATGDYLEACEAYKDLLVLYPHHAAGLVDYFYLRQHLCDFEGWQDHLDLVLTQSYRKGHRVPVFSVIVAAPDPEDHLLAARVWTRGWQTGVMTPLAPYAPRSPESKSRRLRIGYLSNDFYNHATALLLIEILELRDQKRFEVFGYSTGNLDDGTLIRQRILGAFDVCYDIKDLNDKDAAQKIRDDEIDILIDLKGYTSGARTEIMALRPAPIQVNYLGYPATMGASFIDYIIGDHFIMPPGCEPFYDEHVVRLPGCYQPNDRKRPIADEPITRADCGLPDHGFVFCSFNAPYKITPQIFDVWMRLLRDIPGSVLWILDGFGTCEDNLRKAAVKRGIAADRIVLAPKLDTTHHLGRMRLGDLLLDTAPVSAHTTASDALWVGLPVLTCAGDSFVSRVAGSLLEAIGVPELITFNLADYEATAKSLAREPARLATLRKRLQDNRLTTPLFDSERYTWHYEAALLHMIELRDAGSPPQAFSVTPLS